MPWHPPRPQRGKAILLVAALHFALGLALVLGLAVDPLRRDADSLATFDVPPPPPPLAVPPPASADAAAGEAGSPDLRAKAAPVVVPKPIVPLPTRPPIAVADDRSAEVGIAPSAGAAAVAGSGRGAGGAGSGEGGGGAGGDGGGAIASNARLISGNLTRRDYRRIRDFGAARGQAVLAIEVDEDGRLRRCLPMEGSGNPALDAELCRLLSRTRWDPARNAAGRPVAVAMRYVASWSRD